MLTDEKEIAELIEALERACTLFDKIQERKAVLEAEAIIHTYKGGSDANSKKG